jgi:Flp pilus assembly protein TadD
MDTLWSAAMARGDTVKLFEVCKLRLKAEPESLTARNDHLALALLAGQGNAATLQLAEQLFKESPQNALVASTYGFALYQQGRAREAAGVLETFKPEELRVPAVAQYNGIFLAASGQTDRAEEYLRLGATGAQLPEEKSLVAFFSALCRTRSLTGRGEDTAARIAWEETLRTADDRVDRLELLAKMALDWKWQARAETALFKLAELERCPPWAIDALWAAVLQKGTSAERYKVSKLVLKADPKNVQARSNLIILALLTGQEADAPHRQAEAFYQGNVGNPAAVIACGLSLYLQGRTEEAVKLTASLSPEQLREPRSALYHGIFLASGEAPANARDYLRIGARAPMLPEERALLEKVVAVDPLQTAAGEPLLR